MRPPGIPNAWSVSMSNPRKPRPVSWIPRLVAAAHGAVVVLLQERVEMEPVAGQDAGQAQTGPKRGSPGSPGSRREPGRGSSSEPASLRWRRESRRGCWACSATAPSPATQRQGASPHRTNMVGMGSGDRISRSGRGRAARRRSGMTGRNRGIARRIRAAARARRGQDRHEGCGQANHRPALDAEHGHLRIILSAGRCPATFFDRSQADPLPGSYLRPLHACRVGQIAHHSSSGAMPSGRRRATASRFVESPPM